MAPSPYRLLALTKERADLVSLAISGHYHHTMIELDWLRRNQTDPEAIQAMEEEAGLLRSLIKDLDSIKRSFET